MIRNATALLLLLTSNARAVEPPICPPDDGDTQSETRLLRALSLDIRGVVPEVGDYDQLDGNGVPDSLLDAWLSSPEFTQQVVRHHRSLFWNNVEGVDLIDADSRLSDVDGIWYVDDNPSLVFRGENDAHCGDFEATFDVYGRPNTVSVGGDVVQEGWVWVTPYWDLTTPIKVCAFDAQMVELTQGGTDCKTNKSENDTECGCGPNLQWCHISGLEEEIATAFGTDLDLRVARIIDGDLSYLDLFNDSTGYVNGPIVGFYRYLTGKVDDVDFGEGQVDLARLPDVVWDDKDFTSVALGAEHAGVLTSPAWLLRFQTNRGRANRFYNSFLCQPFQPPAGGVTDLDNPNPTLDLTSRAGCQYCHALLEPAAAHWGRWPQSGAGYLDPQTHPPFDQACQACALSGGDCPDRCDNHYLTQPLNSEQDDYLGWLLSYEFLEDRHQSHVEEGPTLLVNTTVTDGRLPDCITTKTAEWLMGREMTEVDGPWLDQLSTDFVGGDFQYKALVKQIITSDNYRRTQ